MDFVCRFENIKWHLAEPKAVYTCKVTTCSITEKNTEIAAFKGVHDATKSNRTFSKLGASSN